MTSDVETFRQGARAYRNARDWAMEQRNEAIEQANERAGDCPPATINVDTSFGEATSFATVTTLDGTSTLEALSQVSQTLSTKDSNTSFTLEGSTSSADEFPSGRRRPIKRSKRDSRQQIHKSAKKTTY
jgi:hypothetical protein